MKLHELQYATIIKVSGIPDESTMDYDLDYLDVVSLLTEMGISFNESEPGESEYSYLGKEGESSFWKRWEKEVQDLTVCDMLSWEQLKKICKEWCVKVDMTPTLGTLGGPLGPFFVPDISFNLVDESRILLFHMRVTPNKDGLPPKWETIISGEYEGTWNNLKKALKNAIEKII